MEVVLEDNGLEEFIDSDVAKSGSSDVALRDAWKKKVAKTRRIFLEGVKDYIVSSLHGKATPFSMWKALIDLSKAKVTRGSWCLKKSSEK